MHQGREAPLHAARASHDAQVHHKTHRLEASRLWKGPVQLGQVALPGEAYFGDVGGLEEPMQGVVEKGQRQTEQVEQESA